MRRSRGAFRKYSFRVQRFGASSRNRARLSIVGTRSIKINGKRVRTGIGVVRTAARKAENKADGDKIQGSVNLKRKQS